MFYICLLPSIKFSEDSKNSINFRFKVLHCLLMLLLLLSNGLNATYLILSNIAISIINYAFIPESGSSRYHLSLANLMYRVTLYCFSQQLWIPRYRIVKSGNLEVNSGPKRNSCQRQKFSNCHWNLNGPIANSSANVPLLIFLLITLISCVYQKLF